MAIRIGTAAWTDKSLLDSGKFYPPDVKEPEERLRHYATQFDFVEVDSTYYSAETEKQAEAWAARTPGSFLFDLKAFRLFTTHQTPHKMLPRAVREALGEPPEGKRNWYYRDLPDTLRDEMWGYFRRSLGPLESAGKLGAVILQFPHWFGPTDDSRRHIVQCADALDGYRVAVEFRNAYWLTDRRRRETLAYLRENGLAYVIVDEPQGFKSSVPLLWEVTDPALAVVRLHGRNAETWEKKGLKSAAERFNYEYSERELDSFIEPLLRLSEEAHEVHVTFNNNYEDQAQRSARQLQEKLAGVGSGR